MSFNRLDVAVFLQLELLQDLERTRGASRPGLRRRPEFPAESTGPARGPVRATVWRASGWGGGGATVLSLSQAPELPQSSPTWSQERPHAPELRQTLGDRAGTKGRQVTGADLTWKSEHQLHRLPPLHGISLCGCARSGHQLRI